MAKQFVWPMRCIPEITQAGCFAMPEQHLNITYRHDTWALHLHDYTGVLELAGRRYTLQPGDLTFSPPGGPSRYEITAPGRHWCIHFRPQPRLGPLLKLPPHNALAERRAYLEEQLSNIAKWYVRGHGHEADATGHTTTAALALQQFLIWLALDGQQYRRGTAVGTATDKADALAADICRRLEQHLSVTDLCRRAGLSRNYMSMHFHRRHGMTIARYILVQRLRYARSLLDGTDMQIKTIGATVGMPDPRHFNKQFRRFYGTAPSSIRAASRDSNNKSPLTPTPTATMHV